MSGAGQGAKKRSENRQKQERLTVRFSPSEREELEALADREGLTLGSYVRSRSLEQPTTRAVRRPTVAVKLLGGLLAQIGKIGSNLNQIARQLNQGATLPLSEIETALGEHRQILAAIITVLGKDKK
jgi:hypothetical protein